MGSSDCISTEEGLVASHVCRLYRRLNAISEMDAYPIPRIDDLIDRIGEAKFITTLDLSRGYWQVKVRAEDQPKTAFTTP